MPDGGLKKKKSTKTAKTKGFQLLLLSHRNYKYWLLITQLWPYLTFLKKKIRPFAEPILHVLLSSSRLMMQWFQRGHVCPRRCAGNSGALDSDLLRGVQGQLQWFKATALSLEQAASAEQRRAQISVLPGHVSAFTQRLSRDVYLWLFKGLLVLRRVLASAAAVVTPNDFVGARWYI